MESLQKPVTLTQDVVRVLDEIRTGADNALYCAKPDVSEELFAKHIVSLVEGAGLPVLQTMHYRWYLRELARLWRTRSGRDLAFHLELCIRKWVGLGLEPRTLQFLVCEAHERLKGQQPDQPQSPQSRDGSTTKTPSHQENLGSDTRTLDPLTPRTLPSDPSDPGTLLGIMSGPRPPITPIQEDHGLAFRSPAPNLRKSAESVDDVPGSDPQTQTTICVHLRSSAVDSPSPASAESVDDIPDSTAKIAKGPDTGTLEPSTPGTLS
jgi:hypothetical protein